MAGLVYEIAAEHNELEIDVIPGITAAVSAAAVLGAPLMLSLIHIFRSFWTFGQEKRALTFWEQETLPTRYGGKNSEKSLSPWETAFIH